MPVFKNGKQQSGYNGIIRTAFWYYPNSILELSGFRSGIIRKTFLNYPNK